MAEPETRVHLCGRFVLLWAGEPREDAVRSRQARLLFAYLVLHRHRPVRRDELVAAVWPDDDSASGAETLLPPLLSRLRKALGPGSIEGRSEVTLVLPAGAVVDVEVLDAALDVARRGSGPEALAAAREAAAIAEGGLLGGIEARWIDERRAELEDRRVEAHELAARIGTAMGGAELAPAADAARAAVELAPFRESARAALIAVLRAQGNTAEALRAFDEVRVLLRDELGTNPGPELLALHADLLSGAPAPAPPAAPPPKAEAPAAAPPREAAPALVERDRELTAVDALQAGLGHGEGRVALIEGPAGLGKTRLLVETRRRAAAAGALVLSARASELEREYPFGVVRQLLEGELADPARREMILAGAAAPAAAVFEAADTAAEFAVLHGLYWAFVHLAADQPVVLSVDDLHWCDRPSLRLLAYLVRRLEGVPVLLAATLRTGEAPTDPALLDEIIHDPATASIRPGPLSLAAVRVVVRGRLGAHATEAFCAACHETTGGNPLLLHQLLAALESDGVAPSDEHVERVREIGPRAVSRTINLRLARLPDGAAQVARAVAVLGDDADLPAVAAHAGLGVDAAARAAGLLARAEILRAEPPPGFVHPLVRDAVYSAVSVGERELEHARAAEVLRAAGASDEQVALHLVKAPPAGSAANAATLRRAGTAAARRGAPDSAAAFLRRALAEPPPPDERADLLLELGVTEQRVDGAASVEHLRAAYDAFTTPEARGAAAVALAETMFFTAPPHETLGFLRAAHRDAVAGSDDANSLEAYELMTAILGGDSSAEARLARFEDGGLPDGDGPGARRLQAIVAWGWTLATRNAGPCAELALRSLRDGTLAEIDDGMLIVGPITTLTLADRAEALGEWNAVRAAANRRGSLLLSSSTNIWGGFELYCRGRLDEAERSLRESLGELALWGSGQVIWVFPHAMLALTLVARGDLDGARASLAAISDAPEGGQGHVFRLRAEAELALADGRAGDAIAGAERLAREAGALANPEWAPFHDILGRALAAAGRADEALAVAQAGLAAATAWGAPATLGRALRLVAELEGDRDGFARALAVLEPSRARLERARTLYALGVADADPARLGAARDLAEVCGAVPLARACVDALRATGAEVATAAALTDVEQRVSELAADGVTTHEIAERLHLTPRDAEAYLTAARAKRAA